jgi:hypothetical protein
VFDLNGDAPACKASKLPDREDEEWALLADVGDAMSDTGFQCYRCKLRAMRGPENTKLDGDQCTCQRPLHPSVVRRRQTEAAVNAIIFGGLAFFVLPLIHVSNTTFWGIAVAVFTYILYLWFFGRQLRREQLNT